MDVELERLLEELYRSGREHDAAKEDRLERLRNLEPETARLLAVLVRSAARGTTARACSSWARQMGTPPSGLPTPPRRAAASSRASRSMPARSAQAAENLRRAGLDAFAELRVEDAGACLAGSPDAAWELVFLDAERPQYVGYWPDLVRTLSVGGMLVVDNVISHADQVAEFRALVEHDRRVTDVLVPIGAGALLVVKNLAQ